MTSKHKSSVMPSATLVMLSLSKHGVPWQAQKIR